MADRISLGKTKVEDRSGVVYPVELSIDPEGYIADVRIDFGEAKIDSWEICDDTKVEDSVYKYLKSLGYKGEKFGRAELGLQGKTFITYEPNYDFEGFVMARYGWVYMGEKDKRFANDQSLKKIKASAKKYKCKHNIDTTTIIWGKDGKRGYPCKKCPYIMVIGSVEIAKKGK